ncbi:MAG: DNA/RNA non-specific endonuclease [Phycisphaeraceae bacterium]
MPRKSGYLWLLVAAIALAVTIAVILTLVQAREAPTASVPPGAPAGSPTNGMAYAGLPKPMAPDHDVEVLTNHGYQSGYSERRRNPLWVTYKLTAAPNRQNPKRPSRFLVDTRTTARISHNDYTHSGFDRGHLAPFNAIVDRLGTEGGR